MSYPDDDLGHLIRISLDGVVAEVEPSAAVWNGIEARIAEYAREAVHRDALRSESPPAPSPPTLQLLWPGMPVSLIRL